MRKSLLPVLTLILVASAVTARADTIVQSGGIVTAIDGITILGVTYNVTFGTTDDTTFASNPDAIIAFDKIQADLTPYKSVNTANIDEIGVDRGFGIVLTAGTILHPSTFAFTNTAESAIDFNDLATIDIANYAEFTPTSTPEPGPLSLMLLGIGLAFVMRKRLALAF